MLKLLVGIFLLSLPFILIRRFKNKRKGFFFVLFLVISFHLFLALITQFFGVFQYSLILGANLVFVAVCLLLAGLPRNACSYALQGLQKLKLKKIDLIFLIVIVISFLCLYSVHYDYTGKINIAPDLRFRDVENMSYPYPYFSDEWYAVSFIKYSINSGKLPLVNPLADNTPFPNLEISFHSFSAEIFLFLGLDPLKQYTLVTIFVNLLIISLIYFFLRINKVNKFSAAISSLFALYITNGANLPGIWNLLPLSLGILSLLIGFCFISLKEKKMAVFSSLLVFLFYPPFLPFYFLGLIVFLFCSSSGKKEIIKLFGAGLSIVLLASLLLSFFAWKIFTNWSKVLEHLRSNVFYTSFTPGAFPQFTFYYVVPILVILLTVLAIPFLFKKKKWLLFQIIAGLLFWLYYSFSTQRVIVDYERVVFYTTILLIISSGFGLQRLIDYIKKETEKTAHSGINYVQIGVIFIFFILSFFYTQNTGWTHLTLTEQKTGIKYMPAAPANNYLTEEDLKIFKDIKGKRFLSIPWKGTVIGVATGNYPVATKSGTISINYKRYQAFMEANCQEKLEMVKKWNIDYVYSHEFGCKEFEQITKSKEGLVLYKFQKIKEENK